MQTLQKAGSTYLKSRLSLIKFHQLRTSVGYFKFLQLIFVQKKRKKQKSSKSLTDLYIVILVHVAVQVTVQNGARQTSRDEVQAEVDDHEGGRHGPSNPERHRRKASVDNEQLQAKVCTRLPRDNQNPPMQVSRL